MIELCACPSCSGQLAAMERLVVQIAEDAVAGRASSARDRYWMHTHWSMLAAYSAMHLAESNG